MAPLRFARVVGTSQDFSLNGVFCLVVLVSLKESFELACKCDVVEQAW